MRKGQFECYFFRKFTYTQYGIADLAQELSFGTVVLVEERFLVHHNVGRYRSQGCHTLTGG